jgi:bifunctional ADP-heptose synthase (sugar kinase/adenylyltransferase)
MKVTAIIPDELVKQTQILSKAKNTTEAMIIALNSYISLEKLKAMGESINKTPLQFKHTAQEIRDLNRL